MKKYKLLYKKKIKKIQEKVQVAQVVL